MIRKNSRYYLKKNQASAYAFIDKVLPQAMEKLGDLIQRRMKDVGIASKSELARRIGKSAAYVGDLINDTAKTKSGTYQPSPEVVSKLASVLEISEIEILGAIGYAPQNKILPHELAIMDYDGFDEDDLKEIANYINFKRQQKGIIGMDIIMSGDFALTHCNGQTCVSFRMPSIQQVDYVHEWNSKIKATIGVNDPCPCGSGRKFKKCHYGNL